VKQRQVGFAMGMGLPVVLGKLCDRYRPWMGFTQPAAHLMA
jgi:hypothetical protein